MVHLKNVYVCSTQYMNILQFQTLVLLIWHHKHLPGVFLRNVTHSASEKYYKFIKY